MKYHYFQVYTVHFTSIGNDATQDNGSETGSGTEILGGQRW